MSSSGIGFESYLEQEPRVGSAQYAESYDSAECIFEDVSCALIKILWEEGRMCFFKGLDLRTL